MQNKKTTTLDGYLHSNAKKRRCLDVLGGKCIKCGETHHKLLEFHHLDPKEKEFTIGTMCNSHQPWSIIELELKKCVLLCCKCHRLEHFDEKTYDLYKDKILEMSKTIHLHSYSQRFISEEEFKTIHDLHKSNKSVIEISNITKRDRGTIYKILKKEKFEPIKFTNKRIKFNEKDFIKDCSVNSRSLYLSKKYHMSISSVIELKRKLLAEGKIEYKDNHILIDYKKVKELYDSGLSCRKVAKIMGINKNSVSTIIRKLLLENVVQP